MAPRLGRRVCRASAERSFAAVAWLARPAVTVRAWVQLRAAGRLVRWVARRVAPFAVAVAEREGSREPFAELERGVARCAPRWTRRPVRCGAERAERARSNSTRLTARGVRAARATRRTPKATGPARDRRAVRKMSHVSTHPVPADFNRVTSTRSANDETWKGGTRCNRLIRVLGKRRSVTKTHTAVV